MSRRSTGRALAMGLAGIAGCAQVAPLPEYRQVADIVRTTAPAGRVTAQAPMAFATSPSNFSGPWPVEAYIRHALAENRFVQAARYNVLALRYRVPQVTALDDPVVSSTYFPSSNNGLQTVDGFMPWNVVVAQQFPWFGTLALRGLAAEQDVQVALAELCAAQLDVVEAVKRAYAELAYNERAEAILLDNRDLVEDFLEIARIRYETGEATQQDVLSAEVVLSDLDRELLSVRQAMAASRADLAEQLHVSPESDLRTQPGAVSQDVPAQIDRLYALATAARPELRGRLAAVARDATAVELARKRYKPNVTLGVNYGLMTTTGAMDPEAEGRDNLGMFLGFNVPIYHAKNDAAVREAQARAVADAKLYEAERDSAFRAVKDLFSQAQAQRSTLDLFQSRILPRAREALEVATSDYEAGDVDFLTLVTAWREVLQIELQVAQFEAALAKSLASLERTIGLELNANHPQPLSPGSAGSVPPPPVEGNLGPFATPADSDPEESGNDDPGRDADTRFLDQDQESR